MNLFNRKKEFTIYSPLSGEVRPVSEAKHDVFTNNIIGDGIAIMPSEGEVHSPVEGKVEIFKTNHLLIFEPHKGVYVVIHFGVGTSQLRGEGFKRNLEIEKEKVKVGDHLVSCDLDFIKEQGKDLLTPIIVCNEKTKNVEIIAEIGSTVKVGDPLIKVTLK